MTVILEEATPEWSYTGDPSNSRLDKIRLMIGDTLSIRQLLLDAEITFYFPATDNDKIICAKCCDNISAKLLGDPNFTLGSWSEDRDTLASKYKEKAKTFWAQVNSLALMSGVSISGEVATTEPLTMDWGQV